MTHPATTTRGVTYVYNYGQTSQSIVTKTSVPYQRRRLEKLDDAPRVIKQMGDDIEAATLGSRSVPFGGPIVVLVALAFKNGVALAVSHLLGFDRIEWSLWDPTSLTAGSPTAYRTAVDATQLILMPQGTFVADLIMGLKP